MLSHMNVFIGKQCDPPLSKKSDILLFRSNLVGMGIIPLQYMNGESTESHGLTGKEVFSIELPSDLSAGCEATVTADSGKKFQVKVRFDTEVELTYFRHGGILNYMIRSML